MAAPEALKEADDFSITCEVSARFITDSSSIKPVGGPKEKRLMRLSLSGDVERAAIWLVGRWPGDDETGPGVLHANLLDTTNAPAGETPSRTFIKDNCSFNCDLPQTKRKADGTLINMFRTYLFDFQNIAEILRFQNSYDQLHRTIIPAVLEARRRAMHIYPEQDDPTEVLYSQERTIKGARKIKAAKFPRLLAETIGPHGDTEAMKKFLTVYPSFVTSAQLLTAVIERFTAEPPACVTIDREALAQWHEVQKMTQIRIIGFIKWWLKVDISAFYVPNTSHWLRTTQFLEDKVKPVYSKEVAAIYKSYAEEVEANPPMTYIAREIARTVKSICTKERVEETAEPGAGKINFSVPRVETTGQGVIDAFGGESEHASKWLADLVSQGYLTPAGDITENTLEQVYIFDAPRHDLLAPGTILPPPHLPPPEARERLLTFDDLNLHEVARQLCLYQMEGFCQIRSRELIGAAWMKSDKEKRAKNILEFISRFTKFSRWVTSYVVLAPSRDECRLRLKRMILLALECRELNNLDAVQAITGALANNAIRRLKETFASLDEVTSKVYNDLKELMLNTGGFAALREYLRTMQAPGIPFLGMYLTDINRVYEGNKDQDNGLINFEKHVKVATIIEELLGWQKKQSYAFESIPAIKIWLEGLNGHDDEKAYDLSLLIEPRAPAPGTAPAPATGSDPSPPGSTASSPSTRATSPVLAAATSESNLSLAVPPSSASSRRRSSLYSRSEPPTPTRSPPPPSPSGTPAPIQMSPSSPMNSPVAATPTRGPKPSTPTASLSRSGTLRGLFGSRSKEEPQRRASVTLSAAPTLRGSPPGRASKLATLQKRPSTSDFARDSLKNQRKRTEDVKKLRAIIMRPPVIWPPPVTNPGDRLRLPPPEELSPAEEPTTPVRASNKRLSQMRDDVAFSTV